MARTAEAIRDREVAMSRESVLAVNAAEWARHPRPYETPDQRDPWARPDHGRPGPDPLWWRSMVRRAVRRLRSLRGCYGPTETPDLSAFEADVRWMLAGYRINQAWARNAARLA